MSSGFITESEIVEARKKRQEEWEKVRTEEQPEEAPEEEYDPRPLFHRLEEQKQRKDAEYEEAHKLKNMIRGLDDDEVGFLDLVEQTKATAARQISLEEQKEMKEFRERVNSLQEQAEKERLAQQLSKPATPKRTSSNVNNTKSLLQGVVVKKRKLSDSDSNGVCEVNTHKNGTSHEQTVVTNGDRTPTVQNITNSSSLDKGALHCIAVLPGLSSYGNESSDSDQSSDIEDSYNSHPHYDLLGRKQIEKKEEDGKSDKQSYSSQTINVPLL